MRWRIFIARIRRTLTALVMMTVHGVAIVQSTVRQSRSALVPRSQHGVVGQLLCTLRKGSIPRLLKQGPK